MTCSARKGIKSPPLTVASLLEIPWGVFMGSAAVQSVKDRKREREREREKTFFLLSRDTLTTISIGFGRDRYIY